MSVQRARRAAIGHFAALVLVEWALSMALGAIMARALAAPLAAHPLGGDAFALDQGRVAIELLATRTSELRAGGAWVALIVILYALIVVPLHGALPSIAVRWQQNPWSNSISRTPTLVGLALVHLVLLATFGFAARSAIEASVTRALSASPGPFEAVTYALVTTVALVVLALRALFALARCAAALEHTTRASLSLAMNLLRERPLSLLGSRLLCEAASLALALAVALAPSTLVVIASLLAHGARVATELCWLRWGAKPLEIPVSTP